VLLPETALLLKALCEFVDSFTNSDGSPVNRLAGEEWLLEGPRVYIPHVKVQVRL
jgi:hypothetical protein